MAVRFRCFRIFLSIFVFFILFGVILLNSASADWTTARFNSNNTAAPPYSVAEPIETLWTSQNYGASMGSPLTDKEDNIYFSSFNKGIVALDKNGNQKWVFAATVEGSPVIDNEGNIYFAGGACYDIIFSLNKNGQERWNYNVRPQGVACGNFSARPPVLSRDQKTVYSSVSYPSKTMLALNSNGTLKWQAGINGHDPATITVGPDETIYVGTGGSGYLFALGPNGIKWQAFTAGGWTVTVRTPILDSAGNIYVVALGAVPAAIVSFDPSGQRRWIIRGSETSGFTSLPALKDQRLYTSEGAIIKAIDIANGATVWQWSPPFPTNRHLSPLTIDKDGNIYGTLGDKLFVIDPNGQTKNTITLGNYLGWTIIPQDNLILVTKTNISDGQIIALGKKQITKTPLILIPGIGGSELKILDNTFWNKADGHGGTFNRAYGQDEKVWVNEGEAGNPGHDDYFDILRMKTDGVNSEANLGLTGNLYNGAYGGAISFFTANGYVLGTDFFVFPYDWRKDISLTKDLLDQKIQEIKTQTGSQKVDIVAHSMGGLVARNYIADPAKAQNVRKLFTLGTPHLGSPYFLKALRYGVQLEPVLLLGLIKLAPSAVNDVIQNMIGGYELAPSQTYYNLYAGQDNQHPYPFADLRDIDSNNVTGALNYSQLKTLLTNLNHNTSLFTPSEAFHNLDSQIANSNGVEVTNIVGSGMATLGQIIEKYKIDFAGIKIPEKDEFKINGDETVPLLSASFGSPTVFYTKQKHGELPGNGPALNLVKNILSGNSQLPNGVSNQPYQFSGTGLSSHSPVNIHVYDAEGNHTGPLANGDFEANIPGSSYDTLEDAKFIFLPDNGQYTIKFEATNLGSFDFKIRKFKNDENTQTILYNNVPLTNSTKAQTILDTNSTQPPVLQVDQDGNGTIDTQVNSSAILIGNANYDKTPPQTTIQLSGTQGNNNWFKSDVTVTLNAVDETNGSGVDKIEYTLDNGQTINTYTSPFTVSQEGILKLKVKSTDKAGNEENPKEQEIKIDKTPPEALIQFNLTTQNLEINGSEITPGEVILQDEAGNTTKLQVEPKEKKKKEKLEIKTITYNDGSPIKLPDNKFEVKFKLDKKTGKLEDLDQTIKIKGEEKIKAKYNPKKNITRIEIKEKGDKKKVEERNGIALLQLLTNKGQLEIKY